MKQMMFDDQPPSARGSATSEAAADSMRGKTESLRRRVFCWIVDRGQQGATCDEVEAALDMRHQTASARVHELAKLGAIGESGVRPTRSGRNAVVWVGLVAARLKLGPS